MVSIIQPHKKERTVDVNLDINNIFDILNGLYILVGNKESDIQKYGDLQDRDQLNRYQKLLAEMQQVKAMIK